MSEQPREPSRQWKELSAADRRWAEVKAHDEADKAERDRQRAALTQARADAAPVQVVEVNIPFATVFAIVVQVLIAQLIAVAVVGGLTLGALVFFGVL